MQLNDVALISVLHGLKGSKTDKNYIPSPTSSLLIEFYNTTDIVKTFDRKNYMVKMYLDDAPFEIEGICTVQSCNWDTLANYLESRTYKTDGRGLNTVNAKCFSHLPIDPPTPDHKTEAVPWWLALVISIPLAVITCAIIKIILVIKDKKKKERELQKEEKAYAKLEK